MKKFGLKRGKQRYRCQACQHQFVICYIKKAWIKQAYEDYALHKQTLKELSHSYGKSIRTLQRAFDSYQVANKLTENVKEINLILDATFFSGYDGVLVFRGGGKNLHWQFIESETLSEISKGLEVLEAQGYQINSVTIDGRKGVIKLFEMRYPGIPIQLCQFHQVQIIHRYTTANPKTDCGQALKALMGVMPETSEEVFISLFEALREQYQEFLKERNELDEFKPRRLRSAFRSLKTNLPYLFSYQRYPELNIPNTTNSCDGSFAHWKQKVKIHRGLRKKRRNKMINFLLNTS